MKKITTTLVFMAFSLLALAQPAFTEQLVQDMAKRFESNPLKYLNEEIDPTFILMGAEGRPLGYAIFKGWYSTPGFKMNEWSIADLKVQQLGKTAIATGIKTHTISVNDTIVSRGVERFTYLFEFKNDKWLWTYGQHTPLLKPAAEEEAAIKQLLVDERKAFFASDKGIEKFWKDDPKTTIITSYTTGSYGAIDNERRKKFVEKFTLGGLGNVGTITSSKVQVFGRTAIADVEMTTNYKNGTEAKERDMVVLEKNGDDWQIVSYSLHGLPKDKKDEEEAIKKMLDEEKKASDAGDFKAYKSHWVEAPNISWLYNGLSFKGDEFWKSAEEKFAGRKPSTNIITRSDWNFTIKGGSAFVTFSQKTENVEKKTTYETYEERYVEKVNGQWKMVNMTAIKKGN
jgi:ketosteroid isomerase-like protein